MARTLVPGPRPSFAAVAKTVWLRRLPWPGCSPCWPRLPVLGVRLSHVWHRRPTLHSAQATPGPGTGAALDQGPPQPRPDDGRPLARERPPPGSPAPGNQDLSTRRLTSRWPSACGRYVPGVQPARIYNARELRADLERQGPPLSLRRPQPEVAAASCFMYRYGKRPPLGRCAHVTPTPLGTRRERPGTAGPRSLTASSRGVTSGRGSRVSMRGCSRRNVRALRTTGRVPRRPRSAGVESSSWPGQPAPSERTLVEGVCACRAGGPKYGIWPEGPLATPKLHWQLELRTGSAASLPGVWWLYTRKLLKQPSRPPARRCVRWGCSLWARAACGLALVSRPLTTDHESASLIAVPSIIECSGGPRPPISGLSITSSPLGPPPEAVALLPGFWPRVDSPSCGWLSTAIAWPAAPPSWPEGGAQRPGPVDNCSAVIRASRPRWGPAPGPASPPRSAGAAGCRRWLSA